MIDEPFRFSKISAIEKENARSFVKRQTSQPGSKNNDMKPIGKKLVNCGPTALLLCGLAVLGAGCATDNPAMSSTRAEPLTAAVGAGVDLSRYQIATVLPIASTKSNIDASIGASFANEVAMRLQHDYGPLFGTVRKDADPLGATNELIVTGTIRDYRPGDPFARAMLIGMGAASFKGDLILKDATDNRVLFDAPCDKLWAWGGALGASKTIDEMVKESEATAAATVARAKGWQPAPSQTTAK